MQNPPPPPPPPPQPFPVAHVHPVQNGPNYQGLAIALIAGNKSVMGNGGIRGLGFLDLRGTTGGAVDRVQRYMEYAQSRGGTFPYWTLNQNAKNLIIQGQPIDAQPGPGNPFGPQRPRGNVPFVIMMDGTCRIGPSLRIGMPVTTNHCYISQMASQVAFAGEMKFGGIIDGETIAAAGVLAAWSNDSGGYRCSGNDATRVGLPMHLYTGTHAAPPKDRIDYYVGGCGGKVDWGRHGPPASVVTKQQDYWTQ